MKVSAFWSGSLVELGIYCLCVISYRILHLAIIHNDLSVVLQLLDVLPQLPPTEPPLVDCLNNLKQVNVEGTVVLLYVQNCM